MKQIKKILVPTDLSNLSLTAMEHATSVASLYKARLYMLYVIPDSGLAFPTVDRNSETILRDVQQKAKELLRHWVPIRSKNGKFITQIVRRGDAATEIVKFAQEEGVDLIVMATHGRSGIAHLVMGSVAQKIVRYSPVAVLTIKPVEMQRRFLDDNEVESRILEPLDKSENRPLHKTS